MKTKKIITTAICLLLIQINLNAQDWSLTGNAGTDPALNFIGTTDAKAFRIKTNNQVRIYVKSSGDVGVGTSSPTSKLHVNGVVTATGGTSTDWNTAFSWGNHASAGYLTSESDPQVGVNSNNFIPKWNGAALVTGGIYDDGTSVGIGTTTPGAKLDVNSVGVIAARFNGPAGMYVALNEGGTYKGYIGSFSGAADDVDFGTGNGNAAGKTHLTIQAVPKLTVTSTGVGIGTTSPIANLHITPNSNLFAFRIDQGVNGDGILAYVNTTSSARTLLSVASNVSGFYVKGNGYAGLGTGSPTSRLDVNGDASATTPVVAVQTTYAGNSDVRGIDAVSVANPGYGFGVYGTGGYMGVRGVANATTYASSAYGVYGSATGTAGTRVGVYGTASGGTVENWGGYFPTKTYTNEMRVGTTAGAAGYILCVGGKAIVEELRVELEGNWPDYVFSTEHQLMNLNDLENFVNENKHLPGMPTAREVEENGIMVGKTQTKLVEKTEENTLYILQLKNEIDNLKHEIELLKNSK